ncbi:glycogen synthase [uncultured Dokdonia sp.]|uniref:glycogen synthase n=1 Tax=uncultured Dokdonia sp. TaxID=575653 RepID=UPI0030EF830D|tara:strand:+ start:95393 stop:96820 length:1428 start_codon:yes stop_codon:yes gene_type:complete
MNILHVSAECYPVAKVGGLADVVGALPKYQNRIGHTAAVIMPYYKTSWVEHANGTIVFCHDLVIEGKTYFSEVIDVDNELGFPLFVVRITELTDRKNVYGYEDDPLRFIAFQRVVLQWVLSLKRKLDIIHCHDHHTGFIPFMMQHCPEFDSLMKVPTLLSIHNAQYQGNFPHDMVGMLPRFRESDIGLLDWYGEINPLAAAIKCAWRVNTVSPSYMVELQEKANGLEGLLREEKLKCVGILNGIDAETWNPATDDYLIKNYTIRTRVKGREANKKAICDEFGLDASKPLFGFIGRLVWEKGADLLPEIIDTALKQHDINIILLGSGSPEVERQLEELKTTYKGRYNAHIGYEERMSHQVYAGADFLLMPSRVEPCGLNQLYSLRYGCMPIVRRTGGLKDTVVDIGDDGNGICHDQTSVWDVVYSIERASLFYKDKKAFSANQKQMMEIDHSWENAAGTYASLYEEMIPKKVTIKK